MENEKVKFGIKETEDVLRFGLSLQKGIGKAKADGVVNWMDVGHIMPVIQTASAAINGADQIKNELLDIDDNEQQRLVAVAREFFPDTLESNIQDKITATINWVVDGIQLGVIWLDPNRGVVVGELGESIS